MNIIEDDSAFLPSGGINIPIILSNALILLKENEIELAASLFRLAKKYPKYVHCGHFGMGQCYLKANDPRRAVRAFELAFSITPRPYIGLALVEALIESKCFQIAEEKALNLAQFFATDPKSVKDFKEKYQECLFKEKSFAKI